MFREEALHQSIKFTLVLLILPSLILVFLFLTELENAPQLSFLTKSFLQIIFGQITSFGIEISEMASIVGALKGGNLFLFFCFCFVCFLVIRPILKKMWNIFKYYTFRFGKRYIYSKWQRNSVFVNYSFSVKKIAMYAAHFT